MTTLTISVHSNGLLAVETYCGDTVKYVEGFPTWDALLNTLGEYFEHYAWVEVKL